MSRIKDLKLKPENCLNVVDILSLVLSTEKTIYIETLLRLMKQTKDYNSINKELRQQLIDAYGTPKEQLESIPEFHLLFYHSFIDSLFNRDDLKTYKKFCELNERKLIENTDLNSYKSYEDIMRAVGVAELKLDMKELEKQTIKLFEDDTFLVIKPLTYLSSKKYGSNTKWCTTSHNDYSYFKRYAGDGILIYFINKITGKKCACYYSLVKEKEFSFWNQMDLRVDSIECELPDNVMKVVRNEITNVRKTNRSYLSISERLKDDRLYEPHVSKELSAVSETTEEQDMDVREIVYRLEPDRPTESRMDEETNEPEMVKVSMMEQIMDERAENPAESGISSMRNGEGI
jgi:hypothetical protein